MKIKKYIAVIIVVALFSMSIGVFAGSTITKITAQIDSATKVKFNGNQFNLKGSDGKLTSVINYNGKNYLAADLLAEKVGLAYNFDSKEKTIYLGEKTGKGVLFDKNVPWEFYKSGGNNPDSAVTKDKDLLSIGNNTIDIGMYVKNANTLFAGGPAYCPRITLTTNKKYQKVTFKAGSEKSGNQAKLLIIEGDRSDGIVLKEILLTDDQFIDVNFDIGLYSEISIFAIGTKGYDDDKIVIGDIYLK